MPMTRMLRLMIAWALQPRCVIGGRMSVESVYDPGREERTHDLLVRLERSDWFPSN